MQQPLIQSGALDVVPGCPGCASSYLRQRESPPPKLLFAGVGFLLICSALPISVLYPFEYFMVRDFHIAKSDEDIGYYAGWLGSSLLAGRILTALLWGIVADKYGRKPVMLVGILSIIIWNTVFGLSSTYWMALLARFLLGGFNGLIGTLKAYVSEICSQDYQALGMSIVRTSWALGLILGSALGGHLSQPALKYPKIFNSDSVFARFPYLLQALCVSVFSVFGLFIYCFLPETLHHHPAQSKCLPVSPSCEVIKLVKDSRRKSIYQNRALLSSIMIFSLWSLHDIAYNQVFSLWTVSPKADGGLGLSSSDSGDITSISGFAVLIFQLMVYPLVANAFGPVLITRVSIGLSIPLLFAYPFFSLLDGTLLWFMVMVASIAKETLSAATMTGAFLLINFSVVQKERGAANGLSTFMVSLFKMFGPAGGGSIYAWSLSWSDGSHLSGNELVFFLLNIIALLTLISTLPCFLPSRATGHALEDDDL